MFPICNVLVLLYNIVLFPLLRANVTATTDGNAYLYIDMHSRQWYNTKNPSNWSQLFWQCVIHLHVFSWPARLLVVWGAIVKVLNAKWWSRDNYTAGLMTEETTVCW